jgi:hypothetical protein
VLQFRLLRVALEAEGLRLSHRAKRVVSRIVLGCFAMALFLAALAFAHIAAWFWLREFLPAKYVAACFAGADLLIALILVLLAGRSRPGQVEREALVVRRRAMEDVTASVSFSALLIQLVKSFMSSRQR